MWSRVATRLSSVLLPAVVTSVALGQGPGATEVRASVDRAWRAIASDFDCEISISGEPLFQQFSAKWEIAFFATGADCDAAYEELQRRVAPMDVQLFRRPSLEQVRALIADMLRSVRSSFDCDITLRGQPSFNEVSGEWSVPYLATGHGCDDAAALLRERGTELQISFFRLVPRQDLIL